MQPPDTLHSRINRILLAGEDAFFNEALIKILRPIAPTAEIRSTQNSTETFRLLAQWHPVLLIIELMCENENILYRIDENVTLPLAPFTLGIANQSCSADVAMAMRYGFTDVIDKPIESGYFQRKLLSLISRPPLLPVHVGQIVFPYLYNDTPINMKKLAEEIDKCIFNLALQITPSKNGVSKLLGISRQLVQYHLKKNQSPEF